MATKTTTNAREQLIAFVMSQGWELDPDRTIWSKYSSWGHPSDAERIQDPHCFRKAAADGNGTWRMELNYTVSSSFYKTDNRLRDIIIERRDSEGKVLGIGANTRNTRLDLSTNSHENYSSSLTYQLWVVTCGVSGSNTLRQRAELIAANPDLVLWLAEEKRMQYELRRAQELREREEQARLRRRPLAITVERTDWNQLTTELSSAAYAVRNADGLTDLPAAVTRVEEAIAAIRAALVEPRDGGLAYLIPIPSPELAAQYDREGRTPTGRVE